MKKLLIIGAGGHGKVAADIASYCGYKEIAFLDDRLAGKDCIGYPVIGKTEDAKKYQGWDFFVAIGNALVREKIQEKLLEEEFTITTLIHPSAVVAKSAYIGVGTVIMAGAVVNPDVRIGDGCIINTGATVDHDSCLADYVHVAVGSHLAGEVYVGKGTWIGAGATVINLVRICAECMIGAGAVVVKDIERPGTYVGVPVRKVDKVENNLYLKKSGGHTPLG